MILQAQRQSEDKRGESKTAPPVKQEKTVQHVPQIQKKKGRLSPRRTFHSFPNAERGPTVTCFWY